jgi:large repetitive protein
MRRALAVTLLISAVTTGMAVSAPKASAAGTVLFNQPFHDNTVDGPAGSVSIPASPSGTNAACLSAAGNATANPLASCPTSTDAQGSGKLRLTQATTGQEGGIFASASVPTSQGLDVTFNSYQYGGGGADGLAFVLAAVDPANPVTPASIGQSGGALGYSAQNSNVSGLSHGYLGLGLDVYGNFSNKYEGSGCTDPANISKQMPGQVVVRGPGNGTVGYCALQSSAATATSPALILRAATRAASVVPVEVVYNPSSSTVTTPSGLVVPAGDYDIHFTPVGGAAQSLIGALPTVPSGLYPASWVNASGFPKQLAFGWVGSTGSVTDFHEIDNVVVTTLNPVPQLAVSQTSYAAAPLSPGSPVTYTVAASSSGATENSPVTVTETVPAGVLPAGAYGTGWTCAAPSGQQISCTSTSSPFTSGTITVNAVVKSTGVTPALIQSSSAAVASSADASPATSSSAPAGTVPAAPNVTGISPTNGAAGGGNDVTVTGTNLSGATAIEIGTTAEFAAGTPTTLNLCASAAPGCFTVTSATSLDISSMPAHTAASVQVSVVSLGIAGTGSYTYNAGPALLFPAPPGGEVGVAYSDTLTVTGGTSPFTWSVSAGTLPPGLTLGASTGLLSGTPTAAGTYSFTVKVTDHAGLTATEPVTLTVIAGPSLSFPAPPAGWTHTVYSDTLTVSGGTSPFTWSIGSGNLPPGISLSADGNLTGTPTATGTYSFTVKVTDANLQSATQATSITIALGVSTTFAAPPAAVKGVAYTDTLTATGGTTPYTWSVNAGTLPPGIALSSAGVLSGTPTTTGSYPFTVNVIDANNGIATASITLVVGAGLSLTFAAPPGGQVGVAYTDTLTATGGTTPYTWSVSAGTLPAGITLNASTGVLAGTPTAGGTSNFTIKVTDAAGQTATQATSITILAGALTIAASANAATTTPGSTVSYTIKVTNSGQIALTGATFTDPLSGVLDDATYNSNASATAGTVSFASPNLTWTGNLAIGASATITFTVTVSNPDTGNKILASTVTSTTAGSNCAAGSTDPACTVSIPVSILTISGTASVSTATPGATVSYTITVTNSGQVAYPSAGFTDALSGVLDDASYNLDAVATTGSVSFTSPNLTWTGSLAVGATATITFSVMVNSPDTGNKILASTITSTSAGNNCASGSTDPQCSTATTVLVPGLTIALTANTASTTPGATVGYTVTVTNSGQTPYTGATFTNSLAGVLTDARYNGDASATAGTVSFASPNLTWNGNLAVGATATITFTVTVNNPDTGDKLLASTVTSATAGSNCAAGSTDPRCSSSIPVLVPGLNIAVSAGSATTTPGAVVLYTVTVTNSGQTPYTGATFTDPLAGVLDDAAYNSDASATAGTVSFATPNLTWTGNLAVGATATITFSVTVNKPDTGNNILSSTITSATTGSNCAAGSGAAACTATVNVAVLTIVNSSNVSTTTPGSVVRFTATFTNSGQVPFTGITIASNITDVLDDATPNGDQTATSGTLTLTATGITWTGSIPVGGTVTVTGTVTVNNPDTGNKVLASTLATAAAGSNCPAGGTDPACSISVTVLTPALTIVKTANASTAVPGQVIGYTIAITNTGQTPYSGATVTDSFAQMANDAVYNRDATATAGSLSFTSPNLTWTGNLAPGASAVITYTVTVNNPDTGDKLVINSVSSAATGSTCPPGAITAACRLTVAVLTPALTIVKTAATTSGNNAVANPGGVVTYTITVTNTGQVPYSGAAFSDPLGGLLDDATYNNDAAATAGTVSYASPVLSWSGNLVPGAAATITYTVTVNNPDTGNRVLANTVTSATPGNNCLAGSGDTRCTVTVTVVGADTLTFTQTAAATSAVAGGTVHYTITIANSGASQYTGASFTDPLTGVLDDAAYNNDAVASGGTVSFASPTLSWAGNVPANGTVTITFTVTVNNPDTGNKVLTSTISSSSSGSNCPAGSPGPLCSATVTVSQLAINFTASTASTTPGAVVRYTVTLANTGQTPYLGIAVAFNAAGIADDATGNGDQTTTSGTLVVTATGGSWTGDIPVGGTVTITSTVTVNNPDTGDHIMTGNAVSTAPGNNCPSGSADPACTPVTNVLTPALTIVKTANATAAVPGQTIGYTVTITNSGQTPYSGATVTDSFAQMIGDAVYNGDAAATSGSLSFTNPVLTWTGDLAPGGSAVISYTVTVDNPDTGDKLVINTVSSTAAGSTCPPGSITTACRVTVPVLTPALTITKTASTVTATPGSTVSYTITVANTGQTPYSGATVTDPLTAVLDDAAYNGDAAATTGSVSFTSPTLTWTGSLNPGAAATITYSVTVHSPDTGDRILANTVTSATPGNNCLASSTDPRCTTTVTVTALIITNTASVSTATPGSVVAYTITITNTGQAAYTGATVTDLLGGVLDDAAYNADATATTGSVIFISPNLTWTGNLAPGAAAAITFTVTVNNPDTGDKSLTSTIASAAAGNNCPAGGTDSRCTATVTILIPALTITKTANVATTTPGSTVGYTVTVTDSGPTPYTGASVNDALDGVLPDAVYNNDATATTGAVSFVSPDLIWTGNLTPGQTVTITYTVTVSNPDLGDRQLVNIATSDNAGSNCPTGTANPTCIVTVIDLIPALTITKTANVSTVTPGSAVGYTIIIANAGQTPYTAANVTDSLAGVLGDAAYNHDATASTGTVSYASPVLSWTGDLAAGVTATIHYSVTVNNPDTGGRSLSNTVVSATPGSTCPSGSTVPGCTAVVTVVGGVLSMTAPASASLGSANPGGSASGSLGTVQVTDNRGFGANWTATVSATAFTTGNGTPAETIPVGDVSYGISALTQTIGSATFSAVPLINLSVAPQAVVTATNVAGNTSATWNPLINVRVPASAIAGTYTATITHSVS